MLSRLYPRKPIVKSVADQEVSAADIRAYIAPQWKLIWWKFRRHRLAVSSAIVIVIFYFVTVFAGFFASASPEAYSAQSTYAPPQPLNFFHEGRFFLHVKGYSVEIDQQAMRRVFVVDPEKIIPIGFFVQGAPYNIGLHGLGWDELSLKSNIHLIGPLDPDQQFYLLGADRLGRDVLSRIIYGAQISLSIGFVGVLLSLVIGIFLGGISGYYGGWLDNLIQRLIEFVRSLPTIPLWLGLAAALPLDWPPLQNYFAVTVIISFIGWTDLARVIRGRFLSLREEDFVLASRLDGASRSQLIYKYMLPAFYSHIIASLTLAIPGMILAETALSFLGLGLREPSISWGVLLKEAQNLRSVASAPWLLTPAIAVIVAILCLNFLGDGLRDAADPYS